MLKVDTIDREENERSARYGQRAPQLLTYHLVRFYAWGWVINFVVSGILIYRHVNGAEIFWQNSLLIFLGVVAAFSVGQIWFRKRSAQAYLKASTKEPIFIILSLLSSLALLWLVHSPEALFYLIIATPTLSRLRRRQALLIFLGLSVTQTIIVINFWPDYAWIVVMLTLAIQMQLMCLLYPSNLIREWRTVDYLSRLNRDLASTRELLRSVSAAEESARIARDIHDASGHKLIAAKLQLDLLEENIKGNSHAHRIDKIRVLLQDLMEELRRIIRLRNAHQRIELSDALNTLIRGLPGNLCTVDVAPTTNLSSQQAEVFLRTAQEGLANSLRHSQATQIKISYNIEEHQHVLKIFDDGNGASQEKFSSHNRGIHSMKERLESIGGLLEISSSLTHGTKLIAKVPLEELSIATT